MRICYRNRKSLHLNSKKFFVLHYSRIHISNRIILIKIRMIKINAMIIHPHNNPLSRILNARQPFSSRTIHL